MGFLPLYLLSQLLLLNCYCIGRCSSCGEEHVELYREQRRKLQQGQQWQGQSSEPLDSPTAAPLYNPKLLFHGNLLNDYGQPAENAQIQFWHADYNGNYLHPKDDLDGQELMKESFSYFGTATTDSEGVFDFKTYRPGIYMKRPVTHIHFKVFYDGSELLTSQFYFADENVRRFYDDMVILTLDEGVDEDGNVVLSTKKEIVVDMGLGGFTKLTPSKFL